MVVFAIPEAVELSVLIGVSDCGRSIYTSVVRKMMAPFPFINIPPISDSAADAIAFFIMLLTVYSGPFGGGVVVGGFIALLDGELK